MKENGELMQLQNKWWADRSECPTEEMGRSAETDDELTFSSLAGIFYILIIGLSISLFVALIEYCYNSAKVARKKQVKSLSSFYSIKMYISHAYISLKKILS